MQEDIIEEDSVVDEKQAPRWISQGAALIEGWCEGDEEQSEEKELTIEEESERIAEQLAGL